MDRNRQKELHVLFQENEGSPYNIFILFQKHYKRSDGALTKLFIFPQFYNTDKFKI